MPRHRPTRFGFRTRTAVTVGRALGRLSRAAGLGYGTVVGGIAADTIDPLLLEHLAHGRSVVLVTGTNGKSTTSHMLAAALATRGRVAFNGAGSNMSEGIAMALAAAPYAQFAVLELDEAVLGSITRRVHPAVIVLLNLSREYTRGVLLRRVADHWRTTIAAIDWPCVVVANADDPLVVEVARGAPRVVWVAAGLPWTRDVELCPSCLADMPIEGWAAWRCRACGLVRPAATWELSGASVAGPGGTVDPHLVAPGRWNLPNATFAIAAAAELGVAPKDAAVALANVADVGGRYVARHVGPHEVRLFLVKNPASWMEAVSVADQRDPVVIAVEPFGIKDMTPQWDVAMDGLRGVKLAVAGQRRLDVAVLLDAHDIPYREFETAEEAIASMPAGPVAVLCNYTAFLGLKRRLHA